MSTLELMLKQPWMTRAGWTLIHFLWQGTLIAVVFAVVRGLAGRSLTSRGRYLLACLTLGALTVTPSLTFLAQSLGTVEIPTPLWRVSSAAWSRMLPWLVLVWLSGVTIFSVRLIAGLRFTARLRSVAIGEISGEWHRTLQELVSHMRVSQPVRLLASSLVVVPTVVGWLRPVILMPLETLAGLPLAQVRALLAHELAHIRRHDYLVNVLQSVAEALLFYHPAVWWISEQIRAEREACCDDVAVAVSGGDVLTYIKALAGLESQRQVRPQVALAADGGSLLHRVRRLIEPVQPASHYRSAPGAAWALTVLWLVGIGAVTLHGAPAAHTSRRILILPERASVSLAAPVVLEAPPVIRRSSNSPLVAALLFDPFFTPPQTPAPPPVHKSKIRVQGKVVGPSQEPLKKAAVKLEMTGGAQAAGQLPTAYTETTDDAGKFAIEDIPPGSYTLSAAKTGFIAGKYGARSINGAGATMTLNEGTDLKDLEIALAPQGTISGRVTDSDGEPIPAARILLYRATYSEGRKQTQQVRIMNGQTSSNVRGLYTFHNIPPGQYYLGAASDERGATGPKEMLTFYPGSLNPEDGVALDVAAGSRIEGIDVHVRREQVYSVKGKVTVNGAPVNGALLELSQTNRNGSAGRDIASLSVTNGRFQIAAALPGTYTLQVRPQRAAMDPDFPPMSGILEFTVKDRDLDGLVLALGPGIELSGSFVLEGGDWSSLFSQPGAGGQPTVGLESDVFWKRSGRNQASADGSFKLTPVGAGTYQVHVANLPAGTYLKSMSYGLRDATSVPIALTGDGEKLIIVVSSKAASLSGVVRNPKDNGAAMPGVLVTVWPKNPNDAMPAGGARSVSSDQNGAFQIGNLSPGEYYAAAWEEIDGGLDQNLQFLAGFGSNPVTLTESSQQTIEVRLIERDQIARQTAKLQ